MVPWPGDGVRVQVPGALYIGSMYIILCCLFENL